MVRSGLFILLILLSIQCAENGCDLKLDPVATIDLNVSEFNQMNIDANAYVVLYNDNADKITVEGPSNLLGNVKDKKIVGEKRETITISDENSCAFLHDYEKLHFNIYNDSLEALFLYGSVNITCADTLTYPFYLRAFSEINEVDVVVRNKHLNFYNNGSVAGVYTFRGFAETGYLGVYANASVDAADLKSNRCRIDQHSVLDCYIGETDSLIVELGSTGNIYYKGNPGIRILEHTGTGKLIQYSEY